MVGLEFLGRGWNIANTKRIDTQKSASVVIANEYLQIRDVMKDRRTEQIRKIGLGGPEVDKKQLNAWRCDMHPSWTDFQMIAFNGRPRDLRQVLVPVCQVMKAR